MANGHGGYRQPSNPAPVSGPGSLSQRTDGVPQMDVKGQPYGAAQQFRQQQSASPLGMGPPGGTPPAPAQYPTPLHAPTQDPSQPVTAGSTGIPGPPSPQQQDQQLKATLGPLVPVLVRMADSPYSTPAGRQQVRELLSRIT